MRTSHRERGDPTLLEELGEVGPQPGSTRMGVGMTASTTSRNKKPPEDEETPLPRHKEKTSRWT